MKHNIETISLGGTKTVDLPLAAVPRVCGCGLPYVFDADPATPVAFDSPCHDSRRRLCGDVRRHRVPVCCTT